MLDNTKRILSFDTDARKKMMAGVEQLARAVAITMGPKGKNVIIERHGQHPVLTKDGVTVARAVNLTDHFEDLGAQIVKEAAQQTAEIAGDGTTTATVIAHCILEEGNKALAAGFDFREMSFGITTAAEWVSNFVINKSQTVKDSDDLRRVANIAVNGETELAELIVDAVERVGVEGSLTVEEAKGFDCGLEVVDGCEVDRGYISPYFVTHPSRMCCILDNPSFLIYSQALNNIRDIMGLLESCHRENKALVIIAPAVEGDALQGIILNHTKGVIKSCILAAPEFGDSRFEAMNDLAVLFGTKVFHDAKDLQELKISDLGGCRKLIAHRFRSIFIDAYGDSNELNKRKTEIQALLNGSSLTHQEKQVLERRKKRLATGVGVLKVGGATELEIRERKDRVDDAIAAVAAALCDGIVTGGGIALARAAVAYREHKGDNLSIGEKLLCTAITAPFQRIIKNAGGIPELILEKILEKDEEWGYDSNTCTYDNMFEKGIIDPTKVTLTALKNATSVSLNLLSVGCAMIEEGE